jgi:capsule polysaccharide export protein KpsC/LpsZ
MYLDQVALLRDVAASLPIGHRLYVKEHVSNRGRRPMAFYDAIRAIPSVRLLGPDANTWALIKEASAVAVITGTMGWEALLFGKPVITFGEVWFNQLPQVYRASLVPKDGWHGLFTRAVTEQRVDRSALLALVSAMQQASYPGFVGNADAFPEVLDPENIARVTEALASEAGLPASSAPA